MRRALNKAVANMVFRRTGGANVYVTRGANNMSEGESDLNYFDGTEAAR